MSQLQGIFENEPRPPDPIGLDTIELSYFEALRAYWRICWPVQLFVLSGTIGIAYLAAGPMKLIPDAVQPVTVLASIAINAFATFWYLPRLYSRPYRGFAIVPVVNQGGVTKRLRVDQRREAAWFLLWRQYVGALLGSLATFPLNGLLSFAGILIPSWVTSIAAPLIIGPIVLKMLIGEQFSDFRLERRPQ